MLKINNESTTAKRKSDKSARDNEGEKKTASEKESVSTKRYNCSEKVHVSANCPSKEKGVKCFEQQVCNLKMSEQK